MPSSSPRLWCHCRPGTAASCQGRGGQHSILINRRWRIFFRWSDAGPEDVEIVDYR